MSLTRRTLLGALFLCGLSSCAYAKSERGEGRNIVLILDASGSMNAKLVNGVTRVDAAKAAVDAFVGKLDPRIRIIYRVYGHQSPTKAKDCKDTQPMIGFGPAAANRDAILAKTQAIKAQGYTPITYVIQLAAADVAKEPGTRTIVLVSDGRETCEGDPCAAAEALAEADAKLLFHTIGFNIDPAARYQLQCIAKAARGTYTDAASTADLAAELGQAAEANPLAATPQTKTAISVARPQPGRLQIRNSDPNRSHKVREAESGKHVASLSNIRFRSGETIVLDPGVIEVLNASLSGHRVLDWETGIEVGKVSQIGRALTVMPSTFAVTFRGAEWRQIEVKAGEREVLNPAVIVAKGRHSSGYRVRAEDRNLIAAISSTGSALPVPPGQSTIEVRNQRVPLDLAEDQRMEIILQ